MILSILEEIAATASRNEKQAILEREKNNLTLKLAFQAAYDPSVNYYIKKIPNRVPLSDTFTLWDALSNLDKLSNRKITGSAAIDFVTTVLSSLSDDEAEVLSRVIQRDLKCGVTASTANKVWKGLIPEYPYMRCSLIKDAKFDKWNWNKGVYSQHKADGSYASIKVNTDSSIEAITRSGTVYPSEPFKQIEDELSSYDIKGNTLMGELLVSEDGKILPREVGNGILNSIAKGGTLSALYVIEYHVWDIIPNENHIPSGKCSVPYHARFEKLSKHLVGSGVVKIIDTKIVHSLDEAYAHYQELIALGYEGTIIKNPDATWSDSTSREQIKLKVTASCELKIVGFNDGKGKNADSFGSIICESADGKLIVSVSGFTDAERLAIHLTRDKLIDSIISLEYNGIQKPSEGKSHYSLFLPRFLEFRDDKTEADTVDKIIAQYDALIKKI